MRKKSKLSILLAFCLAVVMILSTNVAVFAVTREDKGTITVNGLDKDNQVNVSAYQIITVNVDDVSQQPSYPMYTWNIGVANWLMQNGYESYINNTLGTNAVADVFKELSADEQSQFLEKLSAAILSNEISLIATSSQNTVIQSTDPETYTESVIFSDMPMGEYILIASGGVKIYKPSTAKILPEEKDGNWTVQDEEVSMKSTSTPPFEKSVVGEDDTVAIGDTVTYKIHTTIPDYPEDAINPTFYINDLLGSGFDFNGVGSIAVYANAIADENKIDNSNYSINAPVTGKTFQIDFTADYVVNHPNTDIYVTYSAVVNKNAFATDALGNDAFLGYSNDPYGNGKYETGTNHDVYTYGIGLNKVDDNGTRLSGAQFTLSDGEGNELTFSKTETEGVYNYDRDAGNKILEVSKNGYLKIQGLDLGTYKLKETKAPENFVLPTGSITITLADSKPVDGELDGATAQASGTIAIKNNSVASNQNVLSFDVINTSSADANFTLPATGGMGTMIFTIGGILLMAAAIAMVVIIYKKRRAE